MSNRVLKPFGLERFSQACAKRLLQLHPEWLGFVEPVSRDQDGLIIRTLAINLPSANPAVPVPLTISTGLDNIITVSWFSMWNGYRWNIDWVGYMPGIRERLNWDSDEEGFDKVADWVDRFTSERLAAFWIRGTAGAGGSFGTVEVEDIKSGRAHDKYLSAIVRSWRGSFDYTPDIW